MKTQPNHRAEILGQYIIENRTTVRAAAKKFGISKSTVHKDVSERLPKVNPTLYVQVKDILETYKKSYKWGIADYNRFNFAKLNAPSNNREIVISAWKDVFGVDVEIPDDSTWMDVYTAIDEEENNEDNE